MEDKLDVRVHDNDVLDEIEMMTNLMVAASRTDGPLPQRQVDEILGITGGVAHRVTRSPRVHTAD